MKLLLLILVIVACSKSSFEGFISGVKAKMVKLLQPKTTTTKKGRFEEVSTPKQCVLARGSH